MKQCWRWFGPDDSVKLSDLHQVGVEGIVTTINAIPPGKAWGTQAITDRQSILSAGGYRWDVVESLPVSEEMKTETGLMSGHIAAHKTSLRALAQANVETVCYNLMLILDWTRLPKMSSKLTAHCRTRLWLGMWLTLIKPLMR